MIFEHQKSAFDHTYYAVDVLAETRITSFETGPAFRHWTPISGGFRYVFRFRDDAQRFASTLPTND